MVYEAWDHTLERWVAIKEYLPTALSMRRLDGWVVPLSDRHRETFALGMRSFINEARLLAQFDHPSPADGPCSPSSCASSRCWPRWGGGRAGRRPR